MGQIHVVVGGQFGSEAKGHVTAWLTNQIDDVDAVVRVAGPNAGHTAYTPDGRAFALRQIPCAAVAHPDVQLVIGAGSEIDPDVLAHEIVMLEEAGIPVIERLLIDPSATIIEPTHREAEQGTLTRRIGSTGKGIGMARAERIMRRAITFGQYSAGPGDTSLDPIFECEVVHTPSFLTSIIDRGRNVIVEGTQGYGLGLHAGYYPYCTSSDCRAIDFLGMAGLTPTRRNQLRVWPVFRTYPIRVAGNSGPLERETTWADLARETGGYIQPEKTTVTQKTRRVGHWDPSLAKAAMAANGGSKVCLPILTFLDYWYPEIANSEKADDLPNAAWATIEVVERDLGCGLYAVGTGPDSMITLHKGPTR